jgi:hypothetical protein
MTLKGLFTAHPDAVGESYLEHMRAALSFAGPLLFAGFAALVHAFLPFLFATAASAVIARLNARMVNRVPRAPIRRGRGNAQAANGMPAFDPVI